MPYVRENKPYENFTLKEFSSFWVSVVCAIMHMVLRRVWAKLTLPFWESKGKMNHDPVCRKKYGKKAMDNSYQFIWFAFITAYGYSVISGTEIHHGWIGGD